MYRKRKMAMYRRPRRSNHLIVSETWAHVAQPVISGGNGYSLGFNAAECPQYRYYSALYRRFRVRKAEYILVPQFNVAQVNPGAVPTLFRFTYSIQDTPGGGIVPSNEDQVLQDNGCKIMSVTGKTVHIKHYPKPDLATVGAAAQFPAISQNKLFWLNTDNDENQSNGTGGLVNFFGVDAFCIGQLAQPCFAVYVKCTFEFADPA